MQGCCRAHRIPSPPGLTALGMASHCPHPYSQAVGLRMPSAAGRKCRGVVPRTDPQPRETEWVEKYPSSPGPWWRAVLRMTLPSPRAPRGTALQWPTAVPGSFTAVSVFPGITSTLSHLPHILDSGPASGGPTQGCLSSSVKWGDNNSACLQGCCGVELRECGHRLHAAPKA